MAYVDLNPVRAGVARTPEESNFTSIQQRIRGYDSIPLMPFQDRETQTTESLPINLAHYLSLVDGTGRILIHGKTGAIPKVFPNILDRLGFDSDTCF